MFLRLGCGFENSNLLGGLLGREGIRRVDFGLEYFKTSWARPLSIGRATTGRVEGEPDVDGKPGETGSPLLSYSLSMAGMRAAVFGRGSGMILGIIRGSGLLGNGILEPPASTGRSGGVLIIGTTPAEPGHINWFGPGGSGLSLESSLEGESGPMPE